MVKVKYYATRAEFSFCGSPHIHSFLWVLNPVKLNENTIDEHCVFHNTKFIENIKTSLLDFDMVIIFLKKKIYSSKTLINLTEFEDFSISRPRGIVSSKVSDFINNYFDPSKESN